MLALAHHLDVSTSRTQRIAARRRVRPSVLADGHSTTRPLSCTLKSQLAPCRAMNSLAQAPPKTAPTSRTESLGRQMLNKVPEITVYFWVIKVLCTTVGETAADLLNENLGLGLTNTTYIMGALLIVVLVFQFRARKYVPGIYWLAVVLISVVGTLVSDNLVDNLGVALETTTIAFSVDPRLRLRGLVLERADPLGPHHRHHPARGLLLAGDPLHLRPRHLGRRPRRRAARTRLPGRGRDLRRRRSRSSPSCPLPLQAERDPLLLARLHPHPPARRLDRRLPLPADRRRRPRPRHDPDQRHLPQRDPRPGRLPDDLQARRDRGLQRGGRLAPRPERGADGRARRPRRHQQDRGDRRRCSTRCASAPPPARRGSSSSSRTPITSPFDRISADTSRRRAGAGAGAAAARRSRPGARSRAGSPTAPTPTTTSSRSWTGATTRDHPRDPPQPRLPLAARGSSVTR